MHTYLYTVLLIQQLISAPDHPGRKRMYHYIREAKSLLSYYTYYTYFQVCYVILEPFAGLIGATMVFLIYFYSAKLVASEETLGGFGGYSILNLAIAIHISGWIIQLIGHAIFEGMISRF